MPISLSTLSIRNKSDYLLLHISSLLGIVFIFFQILIGGVKGLLLFSPLILFVVILPIYIGYIRGALLLDSVTERIRGWFYLLVGGSYYLLVVGSIFTKKFIVEYGDIIRPISYLILGFILGFFIGRYSKILMKIYRVDKISLIEERVIDRTFLGALALAWGISGIVSKIYVGIFDVVFYSNIIFFYIPLIFVFCYFEYENRLEIKDINIKNEDKNSDHDGATKTWVISRITIFAMLMFVLIISSFIITDEAILTIVGNAIFGFLIVLFLLSIDPETN